jgi:hypothetical protein
MAFIFVLKCFIILLNDELLSKKIFLKSNFINIDVQLFQIKISDFISL